MHKPFVESVKIDGVILSRLMPDEDLFTALKKIAKDYGVERGVIFDGLSKPFRKSQTFLYALIVRILP